MGRLLFREIQGFDQLWIKIPLYIMGIFFGYLFGRGIYFQIILDTPWGDNPVSDLGLALTTTFVLGVWGAVIILLEKSKLVTEYYPTEIRLRFPPFIRKEKVLRVDQIRTMKIRKYSPIWEYGGWGVRYGFKGKAYNVRGNMGLQLYFKDGKGLLIGTQKKEQVNWAIHKMTMAKNLNE